MRLIDPTKAAAVVEDWRATASTSRELAHRHGIGATTVLTILRRAGVVLDAHYIPDRKTGPEEDVRLVGRYLECRNSSQVGREFGLSSTSVLTRVREAGHKVDRNRPRKPLATAQQEAIVRCIDGGLGLRETAEKLGIDNRRISRWRRDEGAGPWPRRSSEIKAPGGYVWLDVSPSDPLHVMATRRGYVLKHRYVMAQSLGRPLTPTETVHHINNDRTDNRLANLQLRQGRHGKGAVLRCNACGSHDVSGTPIADPIGSHNIGPVPLT